MHQISLAPALPRDSTIPKLDSGSLPDRSGTHCGNRSGAGAFLADANRQNADVAAQKSIHRFTDSLPDQLQQCREFVGAGRIRIITFADRSIFIHMNLHHIRSARDQIVVQSAHRNLNRTRRGVSPEDRTWGRPAKGHRWDGGCLPTGEANGRRKPPRASGAGRPVPARWIAEPADR